MSGIAAAVHASGSSARVVAVEPVGAAGMHASLQLGRVAVAPADFELSTEIAHGLAPPFAGRYCLEYLQHCRVEVCLVTDDQLASAASRLFSRGLVVEPSGAAAVAAVESGAVKILPSDNAVCILTGSNTTPSELASVFPK